MKGVVVILIYILFGLILGQLIFPLLDGLTTLLLTIIEACKGYFSVIISKYNAQLVKISQKNGNPQTEEAPTYSSVIGFTIPQEEDESDEEEFEDV